jgi:enoyl-CoA hydratase
MATVRTEDHEGGVRKLILDHAPANAENDELLAELAAAAAAAGADEAVRAVVLNQKLAVLGENFRAAHLELLSIPKPVVAAVNGHAIAGGLVLVLACDYRLGLDGSYKIGLNEVTIGASFPKVAFEIVRLRLTNQRASELMLGGALYPAKEALRLGVVDELFPAETFEATVLRRTARLGAYPQAAFAHAKRALVAEAIARTLAETPAEAAETAAVWQTAESRAARDAQIAKLKG